MQFVTSESYKQWSRISPSDVIDEPAIAAVVAAVNAYLTGMLTALVDDAGELLTEDGSPLSTEGGELPADATYAALLLANRLMSRRNSPSGIVGTEDGLGASIAKYDSDVLKLVAAHRAPVLA